MLGRSSTVFEAASTGDSQLHVDLGLDQHIVAALREVRIDAALAPGRLHFALLERPAKPGRGNREGHIPPVHVQVVYRYDEGSARDHGRLSIACAWTRATVLGSAPHGAGRHSSAGAPCQVARAWLRAQAGCTRTVGLPRLHGGLLRVRAAAALDRAHQVQPLRSFGRRVAPPPARPRTSASRVHAEQRFCGARGQMLRELPPFPAVILLPFAKLAGSPENLRDGQIWLWLAGLGPAFCFSRSRNFAASSKALLGIQNLALAGSSHSAPFTSSPPSKGPFGSRRTWSRWRSPLGTCSPRSRQSTFWAGTLRRSLVRHPAACAPGRAFLRARGLAQALGRKLRGHRLARGRQEALGVRGSDRGHRRHHRSGTTRLVSEARAFEFGHQHLTVGWKARIDKWGSFRTTTSRRTSGS